MKKKNVSFMIVIILAMLSWGGSWPIAKLITDVSHPIIIFWRFFITFVSFIPVILFLKQPLKINRKGFIQIFLGALFLVVYNVLFFGGVTVGAAGAGGVFVTTLNPLFVFLISASLFKQPIHKKEWLGLLLGLIGGVIWIVGTGDIFAGGNLFFIFAAITWAGLSVTSQKSKTNMSAFVFSFYTYGLAALIDFFLAIPDGVFTVQAISTTSWLEILYLSIGATTFGTTAYFFAASQLGANKASTFTFIVPTSAIFFSWILLNEQPTYTTIIGGLIALIAVYLINMKRKLNHKLG